MADEPAKPRSVSAAIASLLSLGKDLVALLRDGSLFLLAVLLLAFPTQFNAMLVAAGFKEGSVAGFKWQASLGETDRALEKAQETISQLQRKNDELAKTLGEASQRIVGGDGQLKAQIVELQQGNRTLSESVQSVQTRVDERLLSNQQLVASADRMKAAPADDIAAAPAATPVERYVVGLQTVGFDDAARVRVNTALQTRGYQLSPLSASYDSRPGWFATRSTVFYYATPALPAAKALAEWLQAETGTRFAVQRGAGLGVDAGQRDVTLYVHYLQ
ncbi:MAG: hypothetical protein NTZ11_08080 [Gammaproteobacteria bacterium]|nr:hypothetical protein [Gammaproteobacteria bacterium]